jgi:crotonobetainyl-CoA:carnitine CoA-transferase CaiB-like acyl-CoA transferase
MLPTRQFKPDSKGPLSGVRVLDLSRLVAGNVVSLQLADFGADVLKVENTEGGDALRDWLVKGHPLFWKVYCRNKRSLALNLRQPAAREALIALIKTAHVFIENYRPGTLEKMELGPEQLLAINPKLVIVRISGYGQDGPYRDYPGYGTLVEGMSGLAARLGFDDRPPILPPLATADIVTGIYGAFATMVALRAQEAGAPGQVIDLSLLESVITLLGPESESYRQTGRVPPRSGSRSEITAPRNVFRTADGRWVSLSAPMKGMVERLFRVIGREDMLDDPRFATNSARLANAEACEAPIAEFIARMPLDEALDFFRKNEITVAPVYEVDQVLADPHVRERGTLVEVPDADLGMLAMHNIAPRLSGTPGDLRIPAPRLGEHTREALAEIGLDAAAIDAMLESGAARAA